VLHAWSSCGQPARPDRRAARSETSIDPSSIASQPLNPGIDLQLDAPGRLDRGRGVRYHIRFVERDLGIREVLGHTLEEGRPHIEDWRSSLRGWENETERLIDAAPPQAA